MKVRFAASFGLALGLAVGGCGPTSLNPPSSDQDQYNAQQKKLAELGRHGEESAIYKAAPGTTRGPRPDAAPRGAKPADTPKAAGVTLSDDEIAAIQKLPEADRGAALAQKVCPVGADENDVPNHLGGMGTPVKQEVKGRTVFLCCKGCIEELKADPDKYLAKLGK